MTSSSRNPQIASWIFLILSGSMRSSLIFQIYHVQTLIFSINTCTELNKKLLLMLYVHRMHVVSSSLCLCKNNACARIRSIHRGWFLASISNTIYIVVWINESWCAICIIFVLACQVWIQVHSALTWLLIVFWGTETMPFAWCLWDFDIFLLASSTSRIPWLGTDRSRSQVGSSGNCWYIHG